MYWYLEVLKKYAVFGGRARRREYWYFFLFNTLFSIVLAVLDGNNGTIGQDSGIGMFGGLYTVGVLIPSVAVGVRRLHDIGKSGWWMLVCLVPLLGFIAIVVFLSRDGDPGGNQYGPNPKEEVGFEAAEVGP